MDLILLEKEDGIKERNKNIPFLLQQILEINIEIYYNIIVKERIDIRI